MFDVSYDIDYSALKDFVRTVELRLKKGTHLQESIKTAGGYAVQEWIRTASPKFKHSQGGYVQGILDGIEYPHGGNPLVAVITNKAKHAYFLEKGVDPFDLKKMLTTSQKVRTSKEGYRYLIIPFRHGTPGSVMFRSKLPHDMYQQAKSLRASFINDAESEGIQQRYTKIESQIPFEQGASYHTDSVKLAQNNPIKVRRYNYTWGEKLTGSGDDKYEGLYRFEKNVKVVRAEVQNNTALGKFYSSRMVNVTDNNKVYSHFMNFRVMSEKKIAGQPEKWLHPGISAMNILGETTQKIKEPVKMMIRDGLMQDMKEMGFN